MYTKIVIKFKRLMKILQRREAEKLNILYFFYNQNKTQV